MKKKKEKKKQLYTERGEGQDPIYKIYFVWRWATRPDLSNRRQTTLLSGGPSTPLLFFWGHAGGTTLDTYRLYQWHDTKKA